MLSQTGEDLGETGKSTRRDTINFEKPRTARFFWKREACLTLGILLSIDCQGLIHLHAPLKRVNTKIKSFWKLISKTEESSSQKQTAQEEINIQDLYKNKIKTLSSLSWTLTWCFGHLALHHTINRFDGGSCSTSKEEWSRPLASLPSQRKLPQGNHRNSIGREREETMKMHLFRQGASNWKHGPKKTYTKDTWPT